MGDTVAKWLAHWIPESRGPGSSPGWVIICVVFLGKTLYSHSASLSTQEYKWIPVPANCQRNQTKCWGVTCDGLAFHPGGAAILLATSFYRNQDKLQQ